MAKIIYYLDVAATIVTVCGIGWAIWINFVHGVLVTVLGGISAWLLLALGIAIDEYDK